jgi:hypothetical protein
MLLRIILEAVIEEALQEDVPLRSRIWVSAADSAWETLKRELSARHAEQERRYLQEHAASDERPYPEAQKPTCV